MSLPTGNITVMSEHFSPWGSGIQPCWHCAHFEAMVYCGSAALCTLPNGPRVRAMPQSGCAAFDREPGADDETGPPASRAEREPYRVKHIEAVRSPFHRR
jgi:hypothetical protein